MLEAILLFLGGCLLAIFLLGWCGYGMIAFSPHSSTCRCSGCQRRIDRAQARYNAQFPPPPGEPLRTMAEWRKIWEESE